MKRILLALAVGVALFAVVAFAATLNVTDSTAAAGRNVVASCGDVTGTTFILEGQGIAAIDGATTLTGSPSDIAEFKAVNLEVTEDACNRINAFVEVRTMGGVSIFNASCEVHDDGGLGFNEAVAGDNPDGCTALLVAPVDTPGIEDFPDVAPAATLFVTMT